MSAIIIDKQELDQLVIEINGLTEEVTKLSPRPEHIILTNKEFCERMHIDPKTAQKWRDQGNIRFTKIGKCIFYRLSDVLNMLDLFAIQNN